MTTERRAYAYYNEFDSFTAQWLRELMADNLIMPGDVDERSITEVTPSDLAGYTQCHFFAGIGGWSQALRLANWPDDRPVWTGSPPCQPFSAAGKQKGQTDDRHLWPAFFELIKSGKPPVIFGEQVASAIRHGWLDDLQDDLGRQGYTTWPVVLPACSVGAPHKRDRLFFVGYTIGKGLQGYTGNENNAPGWPEPNRPAAASGCTNSWLANANGKQYSSRIQGHRQAENLSRARRAEETTGFCEHGFWEQQVPIFCKDGKHRVIPVEPSLFPLANGLPNRVGLLRGAGNAIVPQVAAEVIKAFIGYVNEKQTTSNHQ